MRAPEDYFAFSSNTWHDLAPPEACDAHERAMFHALQDAVLRSRAQSSLKTYLHPWQRFCRWCAARTPPHCALPAQPRSVAIYLTWLALFCKKHSYTFSVIKTASAAIYSFHELALQPVPTTAPIVALAREAAKRDLGTRLKNQKDPFTLEIIVSLAEFVLTPPTATVDLMLTLFTCLSFAGFLRYSDALMIFCDEIRFYDEHMELFLERRKNMQYREGDVIVICHGTTAACPHRLLLELWRRLHIPLDCNAAHYRGRYHLPLFRDFSGHKYQRQPATTPLLAAPLSYERASRYQRRILASALALPEAVIQASFGTQSARSGGATTAAKEGVSERQFMEHGHWLDPRSARRYVLSTLASKQDVTQSLGY